MPNGEGGKGMAIDTKAVEEHIRGLLIALGENPDRERLLSDVLYPR